MIKALSVKRNDDKRDGYYIYTVGDFESTVVDPDQESMAKLFAASPLLLQACKCALADLQYYESIDGDVPHHVGDTMEELEVAIKLCS